jgi:hypothetical protein
MLKPILRLTQKQHRFPLCTRQINNVLIFPKKRQPKLVSSNLRRPPNLPGLQRQRITVTIPPLQSLRLSIPKIKQYSAMSRMGNIPIHA